MSSGQEGVGTRACWFVGASYGGSEDQTPRFLESGTWENGYRDRYLEDVRSVQVGDRIAIKSSYTRKHGLPFDNRSQTVSVMAIKAIGRVIRNPGDGRTLEVEWTPVEPPQEWYFYTNRRTVWRVLPGDWAADDLIAFAFEGEAQDLDRFRNAPFWRERFGDVPMERKRFNWSRFYEAVANGLVAYRDRRKELVAGIHAMAAKVDGLSILQDRFADGTQGPLPDICPFTAMGIFNRGITDENRKAIAKGLADLLGVSVAVPASFEGIPILNNQRSWFFGFHDKRKPDDIEVLWDLFCEAIRCADSEAADDRSGFATAYDRAVERYGVGWNLTMGMYWTRPWTYPTLDSQSRSYITKKLGMAIGRNGPKGRCSARDYLAVLDTLEARFQETAYPVHSFPELSLAAWYFKDDGTTPPVVVCGVEGEQDDDDGLPESQALPASIDPYAVDDMMAEGCFLELSRLEDILERFKTKKNLILQGPPGTGKTWLAKRLAFALIGQRADNRVRAVQFHPNLSYEDFVRGWRPDGDGRLALVDGPFLEMVSAALGEPGQRHVVVIEEINRGNPAQIFGEMLTLMEADKRTPDEALELCYRRNAGERKFIPDNLYIIGTMNVADRSLALVDFALRRRFAFVNLEPTFGKKWRDWLGDKAGIPADVAGEIEARMTTLNQEIAADRGLGRQFRVGHSYVTPPLETKIRDAREWFRQVVETEIGPLLEEYWFDDLERAAKIKGRMLEGF